MIDVLSFLNAIRAFEAAARHESLVKAANELNVSHSVISRHIRNLEEWLGADLFVRTGNRVYLTENARMISPKITSSMFDIREAFETIRQSRDLRKLSVSAEPAFASRWLRRHASKFRSENPDTNLEIKASWAPEKFDDEQSDVFIHFESRLDPRGTVGVRLFPIMGYPACAPNLYETLTREGNQNWVLDAPLVHDHGHNIWRNWFDRHEPEHNVWQKGQVYADLSLAIDAAIDGEGVILADDEICRKEFETGTLIRLDDRVVECVWYCYRTPHDRSPSRAVETFLGWLKETGCTDQR